MNTFDPQGIQTKNSTYKALLADLSAREGEIQGIVVGYIFKDGRYGTSWCSPDKAEAPSKLALIGLADMMKADLMAAEVIAPAYEDGGAIPADELSLEE